MQVSAFWAALLRRWYLVVVALLCTAAATVFVVNRVGPTYQAEGTVLLFPPVATVKRGAETETLGNPYLALSGLTQARDIVLRTVTSTAVREELAKEYPNVKYDATQDYTTGGPLILVTSRAASRGDAVEGLEAVLEEVPTALESLQADLNLPKNAVITSRPLTADQTPEVVHKGQIRAGIAVATAVLALTLLLIGLFDGIASGRRQMQRGGGGAAAGRRAKRETDSGDDASGAHVTQLRRRRADTGGDDRASSG